MLKNKLVWVLGRPEKPGLYWVHDYEQPFLDFIDEDSTASRIKPPKSGYDIYSHFMFAGPINVNIPDAPPLQKDNSMQKHNRKKDDHKDAVCDRLLSEQEAAPYCGVKPQTLAKWRMSGNPDAPKFVRIGRNCRYKLSTLRAWIEGLEEHQCTVGMDLEGDDNA